MMQVFNIFLSRHRLLSTLVILNYQIAIDACQYIKRQGEFAVTDIKL